MSAHILFVDDEEHNLKIYQAAFQRHYQIHLAAGGEEALKILAQYPIRLLVTDQRMPNMTGTELLKEVHERYPLVERMIVTAYSDLSVILQAVNEQRVFQYLLKPVDIGQLKMAVAGALHKSQIEEENRRLMQELAEANLNLEMKVEVRTRELKMKNSILLTISQEVNAKNEKITQSLNYAKAQAAILPTLGGLHRLIPESFIFQRPKDIVSGDFFWYKPLSEHKYLMAMADCTGHGIPGAFMTVLGSICLDLVFEKFPQASPAALLYALDAQMQQVLNGDNPESVSQDGMDMMICIVDFNSREIQYAGARSIAYLVRNGEALELKPSRYGIGFQPKVKEKIFEDAVVAFEQKDMLYFASDGFQDQFSEHKNKLRRKNFVRILCDVSHADIYQQSIALKETFQAWKGGSTQTDDVMVVGLRL